MKRFQFSLNTVLSYKQQVLEELQNEHGQLLYQVRQQELVLQAAEERYRGLNLEFRSLGIPAGGDGGPDHSRGPAV